MDNCFTSENIAIGGDVQSCFRMAMLIIVCNNILMAISAFIHHVGRW